MAQNGTRFSWNAAKSRAAVLLAEGRLTDQEIAGEVGGSRRQLARWKDHPTFAARVDKHIRSMDDAASRRAIARRMARVDALNDRWLKMQTVIEQRGEAPEMLGVPGGGTGLLVKEMKSIGGGETAQVVEEFSVDTGLLRELREHEKQAAQELGQWAERHEHSGPGGKPIPLITSVEFGSTDDDDDEDDPAAD